MKNSNSFIATKSSANETQSPVINLNVPATSPEDTAKDENKPREDKRTLFTKAKQSTLDLYNKVSWLVSNISLPEVENKGKTLELSDGTKVPYEQWSKWPMYRSLNNEQYLFKECLLRVVANMDDYNIFAFKKDLVRRMSIFINSRAFERDCRKAQVSMFSLAQKLAWAKELDQKKILYEGLSSVSGFSARGLDVFNFDELWSDLCLAGFEKADFDGDPFFGEAKEYWSKKQFVEPQEGVA